jgi:cytochrome b6-f complex iron-sulfur subunit
MADERPSIEDILGQARSQDGGSGSPEETPPPSDEPAAPAEETAAAEEAEETPDAAEPTAEPTPKKAPAKAPSSTADILAMARGQDTADTADFTDKADSDTDAQAEPAAAETPAEEAPAAADDADRPSVQEMLQQLRQTDGKGTAARTRTVAQEPEVSDVPQRPMPTRPAAPDAPVAAPAEVGRRGMLISLLLLPVSLVATPFGVAWTALAAACGAMVLGLARFMFPNTLVEPPMTFKIGPPSDYPPESVSTKFKADRAVWIVRSTMYNGQDQIVAVSTVCTHLGCTPNWLEGEQKFKCPCHGSGFYKSGVNFEGPAPRPLERHGLSLSPDGMLEVDKSMKFQEELGQWEDGGCFVEV